MVSSLNFDAYRGTKDLFLIKAKEAHRSWLAGRGWQVVVAELIPVTWPKTSHLIGSNQISNLDHDRICHCGLGDFNEILDEYFSRQLQWLMAETPAVKLPSEECH